MFPGINCPGTHVVGNNPYITIPHKYISKLTTQYFQKPDLPFSKKQTNGRIANHANGHNI
jgi:hypothetical protein